MHDSFQPAPGLQFQILEKINPLQTTLILKQGIVSSRVALLLRSVEIKPVFSRFVLSYEKDAP
jgi:hypothetical protein